MLLLLLLLLVATEVIIPIVIGPRSLSLTIITIMTAAATAAVIRREGGFDAICRRQIFLFLVLIFVLFLEDLQFLVVWLIGTFAQHVDALWRFKRVVQDAYMWQEEGRMEGKVSMRT